MDLYLLRHAPAVERGTPGYSDDGKRPLTPEGERLMRKAAAGMKELKISFDLILSSPLTRALQTAEIVADAYGARDRVRPVAALAPDGEAPDLIQAIRKSYGTLEHMLLVGHEPHLGSLASLLTTGGPKLTVNFKKGGLCRLRAERLSSGRCATLRWLLTPRQLAKCR